MKLSTAHTRDFLTSWAQQAGFLCDGLDSILNNLAEKAISLSAPLTLEACLALTDEELQEYYAEYGLAKFYPELSHETKALFLWKMAMDWRFLGTPKAVEDLCQYIFDGTPVELHIDDQLAWDSTGALINPALLHVFDAELSVLASDLPPEVLERIYANIIRFKNDRTSLRGFSFLFDMDFETTTCVRDGGQYERFYDMVGFTKQSEPTLTMKRGYFNYGRSAISIPNSTNMNLYDTYYDGTTHNANYDNTKTYTICRYYTSAGDSIGYAPYNLEPLNANGTIALRNSRESYITVQRIDFVDDVPARALKKAYFNADKSVFTKEPSTSVVDKELYDENGNVIVGQAGKKYYPRMIMTQGIQVVEKPVWNYIQNFYIDSNSGNLHMDFQDGSGSYLYITYFII